MAIKINGATVITNSRRGVFRSVNPGTYPTASRPPGASEGDVIYDSDEKNIYVYNGEEWVGTGGGAINNLNPAIPPFVSQSGPETVVTNNDGKVEFSLDGNSWSNSITIPPETIYYCDWTNDILSAAHDSQYETSLDVDYPNVGASQQIELSLKIDKLPDPFTLDTSTGVNGLVTYTSNTISPLDTINAPTAIWGSSNADNAQIAIADGDWEALPTSINTRYVNRNERVRVRHTTGALPDFDYATTLNIGYGSNAGEFETSTFSTETLAVVYDNPTLTPGDNTTIDRNGQVFTISAPTGSNINHTGTDWQFASDASFTNILEESLNDSSNLLSYTLSGISEDQTVFARARFIDASGATSAYAVSENLTAKTLYFWRFQVRINGGNGGGCRYDNNNGDNGGGGGQGYVVFESQQAYSSAPGSIERYDGSGGNRGGNGGTGAFGTNGGNGSACTSVHQSGGGGGGAAVRLNGTLLAGVGGGGGGGAKSSFNPQRNRGGNGASLPSANGSYGLSNDQSGGGGGISSSSGGGGGGSRNAGCRDDGKWSSGGGGGGYGGGDGGQDPGDAAGYGGTGGGSWNQSIGYTNGGYELTHAQSSPVTGSTNQVAKYRASSIDPGNWELVKQDSANGTINLGNF